MTTSHLTQHYHPISKLFHWSMAVLIIGLLALGLYMGEQPAPGKYELYGWHKAFGMIALALVTLRVVWRALHRPPALPDAMPLWQKAASHLLHGGLYALMVFMPLAGWVMSSAGEHPVSVFGLSIPPIVGKNPELGKLANEAHELAGYTLIVLIAIHFLAALYHHFICKDNILRRMTRG